MTKTSKKEIVKVDEARLAENQQVGMRGVDSADIMPAQILLKQKSSDAELYVDQEGNEAKIGQFFHTGKLKVIDSFECYFLFAAKSDYLDKRKPDEGRKPQYKALGLMAADMTPFAMTFKSSALYALGKLFGAVVGFKRPMYSIKCLVETKKLSGDKGDWWIPVVRVAGPVNDPELLAELEKTALVFDEKADVITDEEQDQAEESIKNNEEPPPF